MWKRILKLTGIAAACVVGLFLIVCTLIVWILSPGKLTPMVEHYGSEYLNANVRAEKVELTFWHTFPHLTIDVDALTLKSNALAELPDSVRTKLPTYADSLLSIRQFHGGINLLKLFAGELSLHDVLFTNPRINLLQVNDSVANYLIVKPTTEEDSNTTSLSLPKISINRFAITDAEPIRYRSLVDSLDFALNLKTISLTDNSAPQYQLSADGSAISPMLCEFALNPLAFSANGDLQWSHHSPLALTFSNFDISLHKYHATLNGEVDFNTLPMINALTIITPDIPVADALIHIPTEFSEFVKPLKSNMTASAEIQLTRPWNLADSAMPSLSGKIVIPTCAAEYQSLKLNKFAADIEFNFDGVDMNASTLNMRRLMAEGSGIDFNLAAKVSTPLSDPYVDGIFSGTFNFAQLPANIKKQIPGKISGIITGQTEFKLHQSDLTRENFHRLNALGNIELKNLHVILSDTTSLYTQLTRLEFGTKSKFVTDNQHTIDSLLTLSLDIDTLSAMVDGMDVRLRNFRAGAGTLNRRSSADTTEINPFAMKMEVKRLSLISPADTLRMLMRNASIAGSLRRFNGETRTPQLNMQITVDRLMGGQAMNKVALHKANVELNMHMRRSPRQFTSNAKPRRHRDLRAQHTASHTDSIENIHFDIDSTERRFLRRWDFNGHIRAGGGLLITPYFPLRNSIRHLDLTFNQDSVVLDSMRYRAGQSDFLINGSITNIRRTLTSRRNNTLGISLSLQSDTVNVNEIVKALFVGTSVSQHADSALIWSDNDNLDNRLDQMADTASTGPLLLPHNIDATLRLRASNVLYSDLILHNLRGDIMIYNGALNLSNLSASTDLGSISVDGLYEGAQVDSLRFGMGMKVDKFRLDRLTSIVPAIDSLIPMMQHFEGIVNADVAVTTDLSPNMDIKIPSLKAAIKLEGDSLVLLDPDTFKSVSKWLLFRNKDRNMIDHMEVEVVVEDSQLELYPCMFNIDRYKLGVMGNNDLAMNLNYHISVLKSPIPFKFGINIKGTPEKMKIRLGGAKVKENMVGERQTIADNTRINIVRQINQVFRRGLNRARKGRLSFSEAAGSSIENASASQSAQLNAAESPMTYQDSLQWIQQGFMENPDTLRFPVAHIPDH